MRTLPVLAALFFCCTAAEAQEALPQDMRCTVVSVIDGDKLTAVCVEPGNRRRRLSFRVAAIDAPEREQPYALRSQATLAVLCLKQEATIRPQGRDGDGMVVADVECQDMDAAKAQVRSGMAWVHGRHAQGRGDLDRAQSVARGEQLGLWADMSPISPWEWRERR